MTHYDITIGNDVAKDVYCHDICYTYWMLGYQQGLLQSDLARAPPGWQSSLKYMVWLQIWSAGAGTLDC